MYADYSSSMGYPRLVNVSSLTYINEITKSTMVQGHFFLSARHSDHRKKTYNTLFFLKLRNNIWLFCFASSRYLQIYCTHVPLNSFLEVTIHQPDLTTLWLIIYGMSTKTGFLISQLLYWLFKYPKSYYMILE